MLYSIEICSVSNTTLSSLWHIVRSWLKLGLCSLGSSSIATYIMIILGLQFGILYVRSITLLLNYNLTHHIFALVVPISSFTEKHAMGSKCKLPAQITCLRLFFYSFLVELSCSKRNEDHYVQHYTKSFLINPP